MKYKEILASNLHETISYKDALLISHDYALENHPETIIIGQGVSDHLGFFGSLKGLKEKYGKDRIIDTPIAEDSLAGICIGASLNGLYPIQTHMRADFSLLSMNQVINLLAKYKYMFGGLFSVPTLIRMVIGRSWGQGAQHSQSLQSLFGHIPGLTVIMPSSSQAILECYPYIVSEYKAPVISIEHRLLYNINFIIDKNLKKNHSNPLTSYLVNKGKDITIVATSIMVLEAIRAAQYLLHEAGIECEVIDMNCISHPDKKLITDSVKKTGRLIIADTSWQAYGVCSEVSRIILEECPESMKIPVRTLGMQPTPCPTAKILEDYFYPNQEIFIDTIAQMVTGTKKHGINIPIEHSMVDVYKKFRGPF